MKSGTTTENKIVLFRSPLLSGSGHPSETYMSVDEAEGSKKKGEVEFELWWRELLKTEPSYYKELVKIKRLCRDAFLAGRGSQVNPFGKREKAA